MEQSAIVLKRRATGDARSPEIPQQDPYPGWSHVTVMPRPAGGGGGGQIGADGSFRDRRDVVDFPVGETKVQGVAEISRIELSDMVISEVPVDLPTPPVWPGPPAIVPELTGWYDPSVISPQTLIQATAPPLDWRRPGATLAEIQAGRAALIASGAVAGLGGPVNLQQEVEDVPSFFDDLGDLVIGAGAQYLQQALAPDVVYGPQQFGGNVGIPAPSGGGSMASPGVPPAVAQQCGPAGGWPVWKRVCGVYKWVYPKRRRRRQLLTESDYNGLLRIESLKVNSNMKVAIAKALTR